ncbi:MAG: Spy/CpxP family protein refolding chaperone [bacterium]
MRKKIIIILVVVFAAGVASGLFIPRLLKKEDLPSSPTDFISRYLSLSESQKNKIESLDRSFYARVEKIRTELDQKRSELSQILGQSPQNQEKIRTKVSEISSLQAQLQREAINHLEEIRPLLTPEQQAKFFSLIRKRLHPGRPWKRNTGRPWMRPKRGRF